MKAAIFIDGWYVAKVTKDANKRINFEKLSDELTGSSYRIRTYYYTCMPYKSSPPTTEETRRYQNMQRFLNALENIPRFEVKLGRLQYINGKFTQKGVDMQLGVDLAQMSARKQMDEAIVIAADSDFVYAIQTAKDLGIVTKLVYYPQFNPNDSLLNVVDERIVLDDELMNKCSL